MTVKSDLASDYLAEQRLEHGDKLRRALSQVVITGADHDNSIGARISSRLSQKCSLVIEHGQDVRLMDYAFPAGIEQFDTLVMCHGYSHLDWFEEMPMAEAVRTFDINLTGTYRVLQEFVKRTISNEWRKRVIVIGSMAYKSALNGSAAYCASKAGLAHLMKCLAWELAPKGYDLFTIHPSNTEGTPMTEETIRGLMRYRGIAREDAERYWNDSPIRNEILSPDEIAELVEFLVLGNSSYLSGAQLELAGGQR